MNAAQRKRLKARGMLVPDSSGHEAVRVYLQYLSDVPGASRAARGKALRRYFERIARKDASAGLELDRDSLSVSGQMIEALVPVERYERVVRELQADDVRVDLVEAFDAT